VLHRAQLGFRDIAGSEKLAVPDIGYKTVVDFGHKMKLLGQPVGKTFANSGFLIEIVDCTWILLLKNPVVLSLIENDN
jgi:hypothetical protein